MKSFVSPIIKAATDAEWRRFYEKKCRKQRREYAELLDAILALFNGPDKPPLTGPDCQYHTIRLQCDLGEFRRLWKLIHPKE